MASRTWGKMPCTACGGCGRCCWSTTASPARRSPTARSAGSAANALGTPRGAWFPHARGLTRLPLGGNQIANLTDSSFAGTRLHSLRHLDLSNTLISHAGRDAFRPLPRLREADLSRNRLAHVPDVFTPLKHLILLRLDRSQWSCTCDLYPLARFLRNYVKSSARKRRNAKDLNCQPSTTVPAGAMSVLRLSDTNCDAKASNLTLVLKDRSPLLPGQDVALLTLLGFAGAVGLTCLGLVVFNWKLQQGRANEHTSENLCCRTFGESLCAHEARNYHAKGYCNCHLTQENEIKVMSIVGSRKEMPLLQGNSQQAALTSESTALDGPFRNLKGKAQGAGSAFVCLGGRLLRSGCSEPPGNMAAFNEAGLLARYCPKGAENLRNLEPGEVQTHTLPQLGTRTIDISSDTFSRRYATPASALARESLEKPLANGSWQPPIGREDNGLQSRRQRHCIISSSSEPREPEEHYVQKVLQKHRSKYAGPCELLKQSRPRYFQPNNSLICKYVLYDQFSDYAKEKKPSREHSRSEKEQTQIYRAIEKFLTNEDNMELSGLSTNIKKTYSPKGVSVHDSGLVEKNKLVMSSETSPHSKQQKNQSNHLTNWNLKKWSSPRERSKGGKWPTDTQLLKKKRAHQSVPRGKIKKKNLGIKLNLHPFRKVRVYPEKSLSELPKKQKQVLSPPSKLSKASEKGAKINLLSSADLPRQPETNNCVAIISKGLPLKQAPDQTPCYKKHTKKSPLLIANNLSLANQSFVEGGCHPPGHILDGSPATLPGLIPTAAEHGHTHPQFSAEQKEGATHFTLAAASYSPASWENTGRDVLAFCPSRGAADQGAAEPTEHTEQDKSTAKEANQFSGSLENQTQIVGDHETDVYKEHTADQNQMLPRGVHHSSNEPPGNEEQTMTKPQMSHQIMEHCTVEEGNDVEGKLPKTETYESSLSPRTQSKDNLTFRKTESIPHQNRKELPKDIGTSLSTQDVWHLTNSSKKEPDRTEALPRDAGTEAPEVKIVGKQEEETSDKSKADSSMVNHKQQMTLKGTTKAKQQTGENGKSKTLTSYGSSSVAMTPAAEDLSIMSSPETENRLPPSETDLQINSSMQINRNVHDLREAQNSQPDKGNSVPRAGAATLATGEAVLLPQVRDIEF